jgi:lactoylglutathione lyase
MFHKFRAVVLFVHDFETCLAFYRDTIGLEVAVLEPTFAAFKMEGHDFAIQEMNASVEMFKAKVAATGAGRGDGIMLCAPVENVDKAYETLKGKGVKFIQEPINQSWGIRAAYFRDPEGNMWEFLQPIESQQ